MVRMTFEKGVLEQKMFCITWKIKDFLADCKNVGDSYASSKFSIKYNNQATNWWLVVYPQGRNEIIPGVTVFLHFESQSVSEVKADFTLTIVCRKDDLSQMGKAVTFGKDTAKGWGYVLAEQDDLKNIKYGALIDGSLTILCEITFCPTAQDDGDIYKDYIKLGGVANELEDYEKLLEANYFSDVTFDIKGEKMYLHKGILMCRNPVFKAMFEHDMKENKQSTVEITDIDYEVMRELFRFIYSGKVKNIETIAKDLLIAADKYYVTKLKALCEKTLYDVLSIDNAIEYLKFTEMANTIHLKKSVIKFVINNLKDIVRKSNFKLLFAEVDRDVVCEIMEAVADKI